MLVEPAFWQGRRVFVSGHTGFKGAWLCLWLESMGAQITGFSRNRPSPSSLVELARVRDAIDNQTGDIRDHGAVRKAIEAARPEVVFHLAGQPFVRRALADPRLNYEMNVMGTVNVVDAVRISGEDVRAMVGVTSERSYDKRGLDRPFVEDDPIGGEDPYSSSKGCAELVLDAYRRSYSLPIASARSGNVIGGGDWGEDRLVPDIVRAASRGQPIRLRNPDAVRPWQHVLSPIAGYLVLVQRMFESPGRYAEAWNFGPDPEDARPVRWIADRLTELWPAELTWELGQGSPPREVKQLSVDATKARKRLGWSLGWGLEEALAEVVQWHQALAAGEDMRRVSLSQIDAFAHAVR